MSADIDLFLLPVPVLFSYTTTLSFLFVLHFLFAFYIFPVSFYFFFICVIHFFIWVLPDFSFRIFCFSFRNGPLFRSKFSFITEKCHVYSIMNVCNMSVNTSPTSENILETKNNISYWQANSIENELHSKYFIDFRRTIRHYIAEVPHDSEC